jgi:hypothetical protein
MKVQKIGTIVGIMQSEDPMKVRVQVKLEEESLEQRVRPYPQTDQDRMAQQMSESLAKQLRTAIPGALIMGPGFAGAPTNVEEWLVPVDHAAKFTIGKKVRVSLELLEEEP